MQGEKKDISFWYENLDEEKETKKYLEENASAEEELKDTTKDVEKIGSEVKKFASRFFLDYDGSTIDLITGLGLLALYEKTNKQHTESYCMDSPFLQKSYHFMKFSSAIYGPLLTVYTHHSNILNVLKGEAELALLAPRIDNMTVFLRHLPSVSREDIIEHCWISKELESLPAYAIVKDKVTNSIVIVFRGTATGDDIMTDLLAKYVNFQDGLAHKGILLAAKKAVNRLTPVILKTLETNPNCPLIITGHSLGGGLASMFTILFKEQYPNINVQCFSYASPGIVSPGIASRSKEYITSFVFGDDIIARTSLGSAEHLKRTLYELIRSTSKKDRLWIAASKLLRISSTDGIFQSIKKSKDKISVEMIQGNIFDDCPRIYPAGRILHIYKTKSRYVIENIPRQWLGYYVVSANAAKHHNMTFYERGLYCVAFPEIVAKMKFTKQLNISKKNSMVVHLNPLMQLNSGPDYVTPKSSTVQLLGKQPDGNSASNLQSTSEEHTAHVESGTSNSSQSSEKTTSLADLSDGSI